MEKIFVEYRVQADKRAAFLTLIGELREAKAFEVWEGTDQPNLFVEVWEGRSYAQYEELKRDRLSDRNGEWTPLHDCVEGGAAKVHMWHFTKAACQ